MQIYCTLLAGAVLFAGAPAALGQSNAPGGSEQQPPVQAAPNLARAALSREQQQCLALAEPLLRPPIDGNPTLPNTELAKALLRAATQAAQGEPLRDALACLQRRLDG